MLVKRYGKLYEEHDFMLDSIESFRRRRSKIATHSLLLRPAGAGEWEHARALPKGIMSGSDQADLESRLQYMQWGWSIHPNSMCMSIVGSIMG